MLCDQTPSALHRNHRTLHPRQACTTCPSIFAKLTFADVVDYYGKEGEVSHARGHLRQVHLDGASGLNQLL